MGARSFAPVFGLAPVALTVLVASCVGDGGGGAGTDTLEGGSGQDGSVAQSSMDASAADTSVPQDAQADTGSADAGADSGPPWTPTVLGSAVHLWLDGDSNVTLVTTKVSVWGDRSAFLHSAAQADPARRPSVVALTGGHKALHFVTGSPCSILTIPDVASLQFGTGGYTIAAVVGYTNTAVGGDVFQKQGAIPYNGLFLTATGTASAHTFASYVSNTNPSLLSTPAGLNTGALHRVVVRYVYPTTHDMRVDGVVSSVVVTATDVSSPGSDVNIGAGSGGTSECLDGDIAELVVANRPLNDMETGALDGYFKTKYGL